MKKILFSLSLLFCAPVFATSFTSQQSQQLMVVTTPSWESATGTLQRYERASTKTDWKPVGLAIPVVVGKNGMAWGEQKTSEQPMKKEGDGRTPTGVYPIGPAFGFADKSDSKVDYFPLTSTSVCVDDGKSQYYNKLIDSSKVTKDWNSAEQMRDVPQYKHGAVVQYNDNPAVVGKGSCIFLHIWKNPTAGTAGCFAMQENEVKQVLAWLNPAAHPVVAFVPMSVYQSIQKEWGLPGRASGR